MGRLISILLNNAAPTLPLHARNVRSGWIASVRPPTDDFRYTRRTDIVTSVRMSQKCRHFSMVGGQLRRQRHERI